MRRLDEVLERHDRLAEGEDRVGRQVGVARVPAGSGDRDLEVVGRGVDGARRGRDGSGRELMLEVNADHGGGPLGGEAGVGSDLLPRQKATSPRAAEARRAAPSGRSPAAPPGRRLSGRPGARRGRRRASRRSPTTRARRSPRRSAARPVPPGSRWPGRLRSDPDEPPGPRDRSRIGQRRARRPRLPLSWPRRRTAPRAGADRAGSSTAAGSSAREQLRLTRGPPQRLELGHGRPERSRHEAPSGYTRRALPDPIMSATRSRRRATTGRRPRTRP